MDKRHNQVNAVLLAAFLLLAIALSACNFSPAGPAKDQDAVLTAAAATIAAESQQQTIQALQAQETSQELTRQAPSATPEPTDTPLPPTEPPTLPPPSITPPPPATQPVEPPTPQPPAALMLTANVETRCRQGPSQAFNTISFIRVGQQAEIIGRNPENTWWLIRDPQGKFGNCWVWGETTQPLGDASGVPVVQPPPLPTQPVTVNFSLSFVDFHICGGVAMATFRVSNTGTVALFSSNITIWDVTNNVGLAGPEASNNPFLVSASDCPPGFSSLPPGSSGFVTKGMGMLPAPGTKGRGIVVLCTQNNLNGQCLEQRVNFKFP